MKAESGKLKPEKGKAVKRKKAESGKLLQRTRSAGQARKPEKGKVRRKRAETLKSEKAKPGTCDKSQTAPKCLSARHELFAQLVAEGKSGKEAYNAVYGPRKAAEAMASRLLSNAKVAGRVAELQKASAAGAVLSLAEKREFLRKVVVTAIGVVDETSDLCQAAEYSDSGRKFKMPCKLRAIELDAKLSGELRESALEVNASGDINIVVSPKQLAELQKRRAEALRK